MAIGGNNICIIERRTDSINAIGETIPTWQAIAHINGWMDMLTGTTSTAQNARIAQSTHIFIADYKELPEICTDVCRAQVDGVIYQIQYVDNPMEMNRQIEIYLSGFGV